VFNVGGDSVSPAVKHNSDEDFRCSTYHSSKEELKAGISQAQ
jgi:hypothetical protein